MKIKLNEIIFLILLLASVIIIGFFNKFPFEDFLDGRYNKSTLIQMIVFFIATVLAYIHLYQTYKETKTVTKDLYYLVIGYIILFPIFFGVLMILGNLFSN